MTTYNPEPKDININSSAAVLRNYTLAFVSFLLYVLITAASTTHEQLLRISTVKLPLLNIDIPIVQFYLVSPLLILILHFHLLLQHFLFSQQYYGFDKSLKAKYPELKDRIQFMKDFSGNMSLVHLLGSYQKISVQILLVVILAICLLIFPLFDLWFLQAKFLPFHNTDYTNSQVLMVVLDCVMLLALLPKTFDENDNAFRWWLSVFSPLLYLKRWYLQALIAFLRYYEQRGSLRLFNRVWDKDAITQKLEQLIPQYNETLQIKIASFKKIVSISGFFSFVTVIFFWSVFVSTLPEFKYEEKENLFINDREKWLLQNNLGQCNDDVNPITFILGLCSTYSNYSIALTETLHENIEFLYRNIYLSEKTITADEKLSHELENTLDKESSLEKIAGINLQKRDLRWAGFYRTKLPKADFREANLEGISFQEAQLQGAKFYGANLYRTQSSSANIQGVLFNKTNLQRASFMEANLQGTEFKDLNLQEAIFWKSQLQGAYFVRVKLQGTQFTEIKNGKETIKVRANLKGAYFSQVEYSDSIDKNNQSKKTDFPIESQLELEIPCLTDDKNLPICKKYNPKDTETLNKITAYWINDLACSDKWVAQGVIRNYLFDEENTAKFKTYLIPLLKKKLTDKDCLGIQNLPDDFKQQIKDAIK